jgi:hypothetical protein
MYSDGDSDELDYAEMYQAVQERGREVKVVVWCSISSCPAATVFRLIRQCVLALHNRKHRKQLAQQDQQQAKLRHQSSLIQALQQQQ